jgi:lysophospholipid acyltransferase (LPLAT)-like uncharacterized protein
VGDGRRGAASAIGRVTAALLRRVARTATFKVTATESELAAVQSCAPLAERLLTDAAKGHVVVPFWSAHQLTIALLALERFGLRPALERFEIVADDSFGGRVMRRLGESLDLTMRPIHTRGTPQRLEDVGSWLRNPAPFFIAVDGGSPYGTVPTGIIRLAARLKSTLWPLAVRARPSLRCPGIVAEIPLPRATVALAVASPMMVNRREPVEQAAADLKHRMNDATMAASALLESRGSWASAARPPCETWRR